MEAYRDRYAELRARSADVVGISTDDVPTLDKFRKELKTPFRMLSDAGGKVSEKYGGVNNGLSNRATVVIAQDGKILQVIEGRDAIDPTGAIAACPAPKSKAGAP